MDYELLAAAVLLGCGMVSNLTLVICLRHTWAHWTAMKVYVVVVAVGCWLHVLFTLTSRLAVLVIDSMEVDDAACKLLSALTDLGPSVTSMATAAMAMHVLLACLTGSHGSKLRHAFVVGLFVVLSFPFPASKVHVYGVLNLFGTSVCTLTAFLYRDDQRQLQLYYRVAGAVSLYVFPILVTLGGLFGAYMVQCCAARAKPSRDARRASRERQGGEAATLEEVPISVDMVLASILGFLLMACCAPLQAYDFYYTDDDTKLTTDKADIHRALGYLLHSNVILTPFVCVIIGYVHMYRRRRRAYSLDRDRTLPIRGESHKLVN